MSGIEDVNVPLEVRFASLKSILPPWVFDHITADIPVQKLTVQTVEDCEAMLMAFRKYHKIIHVKNIPRRSRYSKLTIEEIAITTPEFFEPKYKKYYEEFKALRPRNSGLNYYDDCIVDHSETKNENSRRASSSRSSSFTEELEEPYRNRTTFPQDYVRICMESTYGRRRQENSFSVVVDEADPFGDCEPDDGLRENVYLI